MWVLVCGGSHQELSPGSATEPGREPTAAIPLLHSSAFPLLLFLIKQGINSTHPPTPEAEAAREMETTNPSVTVPRSPASANPPEKASWLSQPVDNRGQPRPAAAIGAAKTCLGTWGEAPGKVNLSLLINSQEARELVPRKKIAPNNISAKHEGPRGAASVLEPRSTSPGKAGGAAGSSTTRTAPGRSTYQK